MVGETNSNNVKTSYKISDYINSASQTNASQISWVNSSPQQILFTANHTGLAILTYTVNYTNMGSIKFYLNDDYLCGFSSHETVSASGVLTTNLDIDGPVKIMVNKGDIISALGESRNYSGTTYINAGNIVMTEYY